MPSTPTQRSARRSSSSGLVLPNATLDVADKDMLAPLASASDDAMEAHKAQSDKANQLAQRAERAAATTEALRQQAEQRSTRLSDRQVAVRERKASYETAASELPVGYRPDVPLPQTHFGPYRAG